MPLKILTQVLSSWCPKGYSAKKNTSSDISARYLKSGGIYIPM